jgi:hypothetical protein
MNRKTGCLLTAIFLLQGPAFAAPRACRTAAATPESMTWNFSKEGSRLLQDIRQEARDARMETAKLEVQARNPMVDWQTHAIELSAVRYDVNHMGEKLCRLETIRGQLAPDQQKAVDETARLTKEMAIFTQDAILFLNDHHDNLWNPVYRAYIHDVYQEAASVNHAAARTHEG